MKKLLIALVVSALLVPAASAQVRVKGYYKKDGAYVQPHYRSSPNNSSYDNYSTKGNINPYTGKPGTRDPNATQGTANPYSTEPSCTYYCPD